MEDFLDSLASPTPTPGGGSAGAMTAATAAALAEMAAGLALKKEKPGAQALAARARALRTWFTGAAADDAAAYDSVMAAFRLPKESPQRQGAIAQALKGAALSPLAVIARITELAALLRDVGEICPKACHTDFEAAALLAAAAVEIEQRNVRVNLDGAADADELAAQLQEELGSATAALAAVGV